jgi:MFS transporter, YNFM family, putative membrane transport protein
MYSNLERSAIANAGASQQAESHSFRLFIIGITAFLTVVDLFAAQALLPTLAAAYQVPPSAIGLAVNACTLGMAIGGLLIALYSQRIDRRRGIVASLLVLSVPTTLLAFAPNLWVFAGLRVLQGLCMASAFGLTLAHLGERFSAQQTASAFAAYITGNVASNLVGRLIATAVVDHAGLAANFFVFAGLNLAGAALVFATVPPGARPAQSPATTGATSGGMTAMMDSAMTDAWADHLRRPQMRAAFGIGFCILFAFIGTFSYINFVLVKPPLSVGMMTLGVIYFVFLPSIFTTPLAGAAAQRIGHRRALWIGLGVAAAGLPLIILPSLPAVIAGMVLVAVGTFFAQALATGYVSRAAQGNRAAASGLYLASYFAGGLAGSAVLGQIFDRFGWTACVGGVAVALIVASVLTRALTDE